MFSVLILHTEDTYNYQKKLAKMGENINLKNISGKKLMCSFSTLKDIEGKIPFKNRTIAFSGKGDYHYLTYLFLKRIKKPFTLVVFDNHLDNQTIFDKNFISCGSWINNALNLKSVEKIIVVKPKKEFSDNKKLKIIGFEPETLERDLKKSRNIYISIDKDILSEKHLKTNWDGGDFSPQMVLKMLENIPEEKIIGADICGEPDENNIFEIQKSERINLMLLNAIAKSPIFKREFVS